MLITKMHSRCSQTDLDIASPISRRCVRVYALKSTRNTKRSQPVEQTFNHVLANPMDAY
jgi:hypothetical protein